jgi:myo-inositol-1(or 4)-monophosphatase
MGPKPGDKSEGRGTGAGPGPAIDDLAVENLLREVGRYQLEGYRSLSRGPVAIKEDSGHGLSVVTEYDLETERRVQAFVAERFPGDSFLGEELGNIRKDPRRTWVLDPIDGTSNFTQAIPFWGPSLAFWDAAGPARGWIYFPALDQMFRAARGGGAFRDGARIHTSGAAEYSNLVTVATVSRLHRRFRLTCPAKHRILGSIVVNFAYLASGSFAAMYCRGSVWDLAAGVLLAREAGAVLECDPPLESLDLAALDPRKSPSISVYAMANARLPSFRRYIEPLPQPIQGR